ncbi:checkpoint protein HUS1-like [Eriocheir sinensis]|uniref:checkpoint protein HUS1-like n=1 Tax=Eriocheir sinensis TaxID=95602 RepID=UPI0021C81632|nr:checkpoint protein HUS1-like [Eriocheir sinensis]
MKFSGTMMELISIRQFAHVVGSLARLSKMCVVRITPTHLYFIINEPGALNRAPGLWAELDQGHYFTNVVMAGVSQEHNEIFLEFEPDKLSGTLSSLKSHNTSIRTLKIKLAKKLSPCLTIEMQLPSFSDHARTVVHDVPVVPLPRRQWHLYQEPEMPHFSVSLYLPPLKKLRHVVERMKSLASALTLSANRKGMLVLSVTSDTASVSTYFRNLSKPTWDLEGAPTQGDEEQLFSATVEIKKLSSFLAGEQVGPAKVICNIVDERMIHMFLLHEDVTIQYFLPATRTT